ncbi:MAG: hypothetical protein LBT05_08740 [Planctomycetaceae bacterium]|nr:hypothetical protein [Planctomycetaceae bacterium]
MQRLLFLIPTLFAACFLSGCGEKETPQPNHRRDVVADTNKTSADSADGTLSSDDRLPPTESDSPPPVFLRFPPVAALSRPIQLAEEERKRSGFRAGDDFSLEQALQTGALIHRQWTPLPPINAAALRTQNIRELRGKYLSLFTDLPPSSSVEELPKVFDLAVAEYCRYFGVEESVCDQWRMRGCLIQDLRKFQRTNLLGAFPTSRNGYTIGDMFWVREQPSEYMRRHLILHEGVHGFMNYVFGACGPAWFMEATAEYLGTHRWRDGTLTLGILPDNEQEMPGWGRISALREELDAGNAVTLDRLLRRSAEEIETPTDYAYAWGLGFLLENHSRYPTLLRSMARWATFPDFTNRFYQLANWNLLQTDWYCFLGDLDYGAELSKIVVEMNAEESRTVEEPAELEIAPTRGWQTSRIRLEEGKTYRIAASGRCVLGGYPSADSPKTLQSEPNGVTIRYYRHRPLGQLLAAVAPDDFADANAEEKELQPKDIPFLAPIVVGYTLELTPSRSGTLWFRVNVPPSGFERYSGAYRARIEK